MNILKIFDFYLRPVKFLASIQDEKDFKRSFFIAAFVFLICEIVAVDHYLILRISVRDFVIEIVQNLLAKLIVLFVVSSTFFIIIRGFSSIRFHRVFRMFSWTAAYSIPLFLLDDVNVLGERCLDSRAAVFTGLVVLKCLVCLWMARVLVMTAKIYSGMKWPRFIVMLGISSIGVALILFVLRFAGLGLRIIGRSVFI